MKTIAVDLGGTRTKVGIIESNSILDYSLADSHSDESFDVTIGNLEKLIDTLLSKNKISTEALKGIGFAFPGIVDVKKSRVISTNKKFDQARAFDFTAWAQSVWKLPVVLENDARAALAGEWQCGAGKGCDNIVMMTLGTGVGGVCLIEGKLLYGKHFQAGVLGGHFTVNYDKNICTCGNVGCVEAIASSWNIKQKIRTHTNFPGSLLAKEVDYDYEALFKCYQAGDGVAVEILNESLKAWAAGTVTMVHAYDPELVILHGGVMKSADIIIPFVQDWVRKYAWTPWGEVKIRKSSSEDLAALYGMHYLVLNKTEKQ